MLYWAIYFNVYSIALSLHFDVLKSMIYLLLLLILLFGNNNRIFALCQVTKKSQKSVLSRF